MRNDLLVALSKAWRVAGGCEHADSTTRKVGTLNSNTNQTAGVTCPECYLAPEQVPPGKHYAIDYGPGLVLCPDCGLVRHRGETIDQIQNRKRTAQARSAFHEDCRRGKYKQTDPCGAPKPPPKFTPVRFEQGCAGFPEPDRTSRATSVERRDDSVSPYITKELEDWIRAQSALIQGTDSDLVRAALSWAHAFRPEVPDKVISESKSRRRLPVRLTAVEKMCLDNLAAEAGLNPTRYTLSILDLMRRRSSVCKEFRRSLGLPIDKR